jgi:hypothetical protein
MRLAVWITQQISTTVVSLRGKDSDHADELVRASSLAGKGVDTRSHLLAVVNVGKVRRCCSSSCVCVGWQLTSRH